MPEQQVVTVPGGQIAVRRWGSGPPLMLLHGLPGSASTWTAAAERLRHRAELIVPDLLGFGRSSRPGSIDVLHAEGQSRALEALLDELGLARVAVVGHDFGGPIALRLVARRPDLVSHLGLLATNAFSDTPVPFPIRLVTWPIIGRFAQAALFSRPSLKLMVRQGMGKPAPSVDAAHYLGDAGQVRTISTIFAASLRNLEELYTPVEASLHQVGVPTLVGWGDRDPFFTVGQGQRTARAIPGAVFKLYEQAGHFLPEERPEAVAADIAALLEAKVPT